MASSPPLRSQNNLEDTLLYFSRYDYPLTLDELWFWQHGTQAISPSSIPPLKLRGGKGVIFKNGYYYLPGQERLINFRKKREVISKKKWLIAERVGDKLSKIPFIEAVFVTGSLAMSNCTPDADIDLMIITTPNTLWLTRPLVYLFLHSIRRKPLVKSAPDKICDNLYLDTNSLQLKAKSLYLAHEILQAKCIFDRGGVHRQVLLANAWVEKYLPVAYKYLTLGPSPEFRRGKPQQGEVFWKFINSILFVIQYLYMKPKMTSERVTLGSAFFHPSSPVVNSKVNPND